MTYKDVGLCKFTWIARPIGMGVRRSFCRGQQIFFNCWVTFTHKSQTGENNPGFTIQTHIISWIVQQIYSLILITYPLFLSTLPYKTHKYSTCYLFLTITYTAIIVCTPLKLLPMFSCKCFPNILYTRCST